MHMNDLVEKRTTMRADADALITRAADEARDLSMPTSCEHADLVTEIREVEDRLDAARDAEIRELRAASVTAASTRAPLRAVARRAARQHRRLVHTISGKGRAPIGNDVQTSWLASCAPAVQAARLVRLARDPDRPDPGRRAQAQDRRPGDRVERGRRHPRQRRVRRRVDRHHPGEVLLLLRSDQQRGLGRRGPLDPRRLRPRHRAPARPGLGDGPRDRARGRRHGDRHRRQLRRPTST